MDESFGSRLKHAWNVFLNREPTEVLSYQDIGYSSYSRPDRVVLTGGNDRSIVTSIINRIGMDCAAVKILHAKVDENDKYVDTIKSSLNYCLTTEANIDQTGRAFIQDAVMSMLDEGSIAIVPVETSSKPEFSSFKIENMRVGKIQQWYPKHVRVLLYNELNGKKEEVTLPKSMVSIVENPLYSVMNENNSTAKRLSRKLALLDFIDEQGSSGKFNMIIQLPYTIRTDARKKQAEERKADVEEQLSKSKYGVAYIDATEKITQLNRPLENSLLEEVDRLTSMLYGQLGMTESVMNGTADEKEMLNYYNRTIEPIMSSLADEMKRKFLTKTARSQHQSIVFFRDPFKLIPAADFAKIADTYTRNEIMTSNEVRQLVGMKPSSDPHANELRNKNMPVSDQPEENSQDQDKNGDVKSLYSQIKSKVTEKNQNAQKV